MLTIQVISYKGTPPQAPQVGVFAEGTGSIGRGDGNTLVLPDPERQISRTHVRITLTNGQYRIDNQGAGLAVLINDRALEPGESSVLAHADQLQLGPYLMRVALALPKAAAAAPAPVVDPPTVPAARRKAPESDPLALLGDSDASTADPFADLLAPPPAAAPQAPVALLPDDFDPFAPPPPPPAAAAAGGAQRPLDLGSGPGVPSQSLDELFGLGSGSGSGPFAPGHPLAEPIHQANTARGADPLAALQAGAAQTAKPASTQRDDAPEINAAFQLPRMVSNAPPQKGAAAKPPVARTPQAPAPRPAPPPQPSQRASTPERAFRSWEHADKRGEISGVKKFDVEATVRAPSAPTAPRAPAPNPAAAPSDAEAAAARTLLQALLEGAGAADLHRPPALTPELMRVFGQLLRIATEGTLQLLIARALTKREVQADATMMAQGDNNPLKFSPTVEVALQHLLAPHGRGFMSPTRALQDAYDDLRSHQFGVMAGMQAALAGVLARFDPARLEGRLTQKTMMDSLLPMNRKARLWDLFMELYGDISKEAEEDFHTLFGREFVKAYTAQIEKLQSQKR